MGGRIDQQTNPDERAQSTYEGGWIGLIKIVPPLMLGASSVLYATGLLITTLYLASRGVFYGEFARVDYFLVGAAFVLTVSAQALGIKKWSRQFEH